MRAKLALLDGFAQVQVIAESSGGLEFLSVAEARDLSRQLSRAAAIAEAQNRARAKEPVTS